MSERELRKLAREFAISKKFHPDAFATKHVAKIIIEAVEYGFNLTKSNNPKDKK
jgi:hypothetical protein